MHRLFLAQVTEETLSSVSAFVSSYAAISAHSTLLQTSEFLMDISTVFGNIADFVNTPNTTVSSMVRVCRHKIECIYTWYEV